MTSERCFMLFDEVGLSQKKEKKLDEVGMVDISYTNDFLCSLKLVVFN
jgi:hypothetical protein